MLGNLVKKVAWTPWIKTTTQSLLLIDLRREEVIFFIAFQQDSSIIHEWTLNVGNDSCPSSIKIINFQEIRPGLS